jgi:alkylhydroperoxidase family enzyme
MRLTPIEKPRDLMTRIAYWMTKRQLGTVMTPMKVVYARVPRLLRIAYAEAKLIEGGMSVDPVVNVLVRTWVAMVNECSFCVDIAKASAIQRHMPMEKFEALPEYRTSPLFSERERAALAYVEEATRHKRVADATFEELRRHFNEREIVEITWLNALENYYNLINLPLEIGADGLCALAQRRVGGDRRAAA